MRKSEKSEKRTYRLECERKVMCARRQQEKTHDEREREREKVTGVPEGSKKKKHDERERERKKK